MGFCNDDLETSLYYNKILNYVQIGMVVVALPLLGYYISTFARKLESKCFHLSMSGIFLATLALVVTFDILSLYNTKYY